MTYQQLLSQYTMNGGKVNTPEEQQAFNDWTGKITSSLGVSDWDSIPNDAFTSGRIDPKTGVTNTSVGASVPGGGTAQVAQKDTTVPDLGGALTGLVGGIASGNPVTDAANIALQNGANRAQTGGNTNQVQGTTQTGNLASTQTGAQQQSTQTAQTQTGQTSQQQATSGVETGQKTTEQTGQTQQTTGVAQDLGLSDLIAKQGQLASDADASRVSFLKDVQDTGGTGFQQQLDAGIRGALSGPGMQGTGVNAQGRAAGSAAADVGRNNLNQRLAASQQLAGGSGVGSLAQQAGSSGVLGQTSTGTTSSLGNELSSLVNAGNSNTTGTSSSTSLSDALSSLTSKQDNTSAASGTSLGVATGQTPEQKTSSGGGCFVSTAYVDMGILPASTVRRAVKSKLSKIKKYEDSINGYMVYGPWLSRCVRKVPLVAALLQRPVRAILYEEIRLSNHRAKRKLSASFWHACFHYGSYAFWFWRRKHTQDTSTVEMLNRNNLNFLGAW